MSYSDSNNKDNIYQVGSSDYIYQKMRKNIII